MRQDVPDRIPRGIWQAIALTTPAGRLVSPHVATATTGPDGADCIFVYPNLPDPAVG